MTRFSFSTVQDFDKHIRDSIRGYTDLHAMVIDLAQWFVEENATVYDIGCSTGSLVQQMKQNINIKNVRYVGIEPERNFTISLQPSEDMTWIEADATTLSYPNACLVTMLFTLQFIPPKLREQLLANIYSGLNRGGALIIAEKIRARTSLGQDVLTSAYYDYKKQSFTADEILAKERELRRMLTPMTAEKNEKMLYGIGFINVEPFWQNYGFMAWLCVK
jgi:tRNA (cmo5U34)-methyltransferase